MTKSEKNVQVSELNSLYSKWSPFVVFALIVVALLIPVWSVAVYVNQDGTPHLYNAYLLIELLRGDPLISNFFQINPIPVPNLSGHWLLAVLLLVFSPVVSTKIIVSLTFAAFVGAVGWLRIQTSGRDGLATSFLIGGILAFNWMWFLGFYNFTIGVIGMTFTIGLFWRWRHKLNVYKTAVLAILLILVFLSHMIPFGVLVCGLVILSFFALQGNLLKTLGWVFAAILPTLPLIIAYRSVNKQSGAMIPVWRNLSDPQSISSWVLHLQAADPFQLISRKAFPFISFDSGLFALFSPFLWLTIALLIMCGVTLFYYLAVSRTSSKTHFLWLVIPIGAVAFWICGPDDLGSMHGGFLRERILLCGLVWLVPFLKFGSAVKWLIPVQTLLVLIILFQSLVILDFALGSDKVGQSFLAAGNEIAFDESFGSILLIDSGCRYKAVPETSASTLIGIGKKGRVWDNYEAGYHLFPVVLKDDVERQFVYQFREANTFILCDPTDDVIGKLTRLDSLLTTNHAKFNVMLVLGDDDRVDEMLRKWFDEKPFYQNNKIRLFRHKQA